MASPSGSPSFLQREDSGVDTSEVSRVLCVNVREAIRQEVGRMIQEIQAPHVQTVNMKTWGEDIMQTSALPNGLRSDLQNEGSFPLERFMGAPMEVVNGKSCENGHNTGSTAASDALRSVQLSLDVRKELAQHVLDESHHSLQEQHTDLLGLIAKKVPDRCRLLKGCIERVHRLCQLEEPQRSGHLFRFVHPYFDNVAAIVILLNAVFMIYTTNYEVSRPDDGPTKFQNLMEYVFIAFYCLELALKVCVHRLYFFWNNDYRWNTLDTFLVCYGILEISLRESGGNFSWLRALRLFKMAKVLRVLRVIKSLKELRLILACITGSVISLFWSLVMMTFILFMFSLLFVQETGGYFKDQGDSIDPEVETALNENFGSVQVSMLTLWASVTGGNDWWMYYDVLRGPYSKPLYLFFIAFSQIALLNILTGIFVESAMKLAEPDATVKAHEMRQEKARQEVDLKHLCEDLDEDKSGKISLNEFGKKSVALNKLQSYLVTLGIDMNQTKHLFYLLSEGTDDNTVDIEKLVQGIMRMKGGANNISMQRLYFEVLVSRRLLQQALSLRRNGTGIGALSPTGSDKGATGKK
jgi:voltage-gated sodium channel